MIKAAIKLPRFNSKLAMLTKFKKRHRNDTQIGITPDAPLSQLGNLVSKFSKHDIWRKSVPTEFSNYNELYSLIRASKRMFSKILKSTFNIESTKIQDIFELDHNKYVPTSEVRIIKENYAGHPTLSTNIIDISESYTLYRLRQNIQNQTIPDVKYVTQHC